MENYTITHCHTELSSGTTNIDSISKFEEYILRAEELKMKAIAFTEHGSVFSWVKKKQTCEKHGLKYIHAMEAYITKTLDEKVRDNYHCCMYALNWDGVKELNKLSSASFKKDHKYYAPRISFSELINTSKNIAITTACVGSILGGKDDDLKQEYIRFLAKNRDRCFLEIGHHNTDRQCDYNRYIYDIHKTTGIRMIVGTDTHSLNAVHIEGRDILQKAKNIYFDGEEGWDLSFKTFEELKKAFEAQNAIPYDDFMAAIENTNVLADMVEEFELDYSYKYPKLWENPMQTIKDKIKQGIIRRGVDKFDNYQEYVDRIKHEMDAYIHNGAIDFMLLMEDIISWCMSVDIRVGYGRGSCNGSVIAWLLGITEMDSIKHNLNFERFMNIERVSLSDIDTDFPPSRIDEVKDYIFSKTGLYCADIITFNTVALKGAIRDCGRAINMPLSEVDDICKNIEINEKELRKKYPLLFKYVDIIDGTLVSVGSHPCGCCVSPYDLEEQVGTFTTSTSKYPITQINMKEIDGLNFVKLDLLRLDSIELINETCKLANIERLTPDNVDSEDIDVWDSIRDDTTQIFQWEGKTGDSYIKKLLSEETINSFKKINPNVKRMDLLSIGNSAIRPAGASYRDELGSGKFRDSGSTVLNNFLSSTYSFLVFQEQIISFLNKYCGYTMGEADVVRRGFAKKTGTDEHIPRIKKGFIKTMTEQYGQTVEEAEKTIVAFIKVIEDASRYLFSLNHSQPYSYTGYVAGYLRYYYPLEFLTTAFNINTDKEDKTLKLTEYANKRGIKINSPKFRHSKGGYFFDKETNSIYKGIGSIKYLNPQVGDDLYGLRDKEYVDFIDLLVDISNSIQINSKQLDLLIKINFFSEFGSIKKLLKTVDVFNVWNGRKTVSKSKMSQMDISNIDMSKYATDVSDKTGKTTATWRKLDTTGIMREVVSAIKDDEIKVSEIIAFQCEILGYTDYTNDKIDKRYAVVTNLDTTWSPKFDAYCVNNGKVCEMKIHNKGRNRNKDIKTYFQDCPLENGDIIYLKKTKKEQKRKKIGDDFVEVDGKDWWVNDYIKVNL